MQTARKDHLVFRFPGRHKSPRTEREAEQFYVETNNKPQQAYLLLKGKHPLLNNRMSKQQNKMLAYLTK